MGITSFQVQEYLQNGENWVNNMAAWNFVYVKYIFGNKTTALNCLIVSSLVWTLWSSSDQFLTVWISTWCLTCTCSHSLHSLHTWTLQHVSIESPMSCLQREQEREVYIPRIKWITIQDFVKYVIKTSQPQVSLQSYQNISMSHWTLFWQSHPKATSPWRLCSQAGDSLKKRGTQEWYIVHWSFWTIWERKANTTSKPQIDCSTYLILFVPCET